MNVGSSSCRIVSRRRRSLARRGEFVAILLFFLAHLIASAAMHAQQTEVASEEDSNAAKSRAGFSVRKVENTVANSLEEFDRYCAKGAWEKAFGVLDSINSSSSRGLVAVKDGFFIPSRVRLRKALTSLPAAGKDAFRLFNDAKAKQAFARFSASTNETTAGEIVALQNLFDRYFITSIGDQIADRLGDALFESGDFSGAAFCWRAILSDYPDTLLSPLRVRAKLAIALSRGGEVEELTTLASEIREKFPNESLRVAGRELTAAALLADLESSGASASASSASNDPTAGASGDAIVLPSNDEPIWQCVFADENFSRQLTSLLGNGGWWNTIANPQSRVPDSAIDAKRVYLCWFGIVFSIDAETGKLLWRSDSPAKLPQNLQQTIMSGMTDFDDSILLMPATNRLLCVSRSRANSSAQMSCLDAETGKSAWSIAASALKSWNFSGSPVISGDVIYAAARSGSSVELNLLAISAADGSVLWQLPLGSFQAGANFRGQISVQTPFLRRSGNTLYVLTGNGAMLTIDLAGRRVEWAFTYDTPAPVNSEMMYYGQLRTESHFQSAIDLQGSTLFIKERDNSAAYAIDVATQTLKWRRPVDANGTIVYCDPQSSSMFLLSDGLHCMDLATRDLRWSTNLQIDTDDVRPLVTGSHAYLFGSRGVYDVDLKTGDRTIFRGSDRDSTGGAIWQIGDRLICISNRSVTAYSISRNRSGS